MIVKTFEGTSINDAMRKIKKEFGPEATILATAESLSEETGLKVYEVKAAVTQPPRVIGASSQDSSTNEVRSAYQDFLKISSLLEERIGFIEKEIPRRKELYRVEAELRDVKSLLMDSAFFKENSLDKNSSAELRRVYQKLKLTGINLAYLKELGKYLEAIPLSQQKEAESFLFKHAAKWLMNNISVYKNFEPTTDMPSVHLFLGDPGVGKTCTLVKVATQLKKNFYEKMLIVSVNSTVFGSAEQLKVFSKILGIPLICLARYKDLEQISIEHKDKQIILVDSGSHVLEDGISTQYLLDLMYKMHIEKHLILDSTQSFLNMDNTVRNFTQLGIDSLIFSKVDKAISMGNMFNTPYKWSLPISYYTDGYEIPASLKRATPSDIVERILGKI